MKTFGPSNDEPEAVKIEIRAAEIAALAATTCVEGLDDAENAAQYLARQIVSSEEDKVLILRACHADMSSSRGFIWPVTGDVEAPDWNSEPICGYGLHGWLWGVGSVSSAGAEWAFSEEGVVWLVVEAEASAVVDLVGKCKFPHGKVVLSGSLKNCTDLLAKFAPVDSVIIGRTATAGDGGTATAGDGGTATAGNYGTATAGYYGTATAGYSGTATVGSYGTATAGEKGTATAGHRGTATAGVGGTATAGNSGTATAGYSGTATDGSYGTATAGE